MAVKFELDLNVQNRKLPNNNAKRLSKPLNNHVFILFLCMLSLSCDSVQVSQCLNKRTEQLTKPLTTTSVYGRIGNLMNRIDAVNIFVPVPNQDRWSLNCAWEVVSEIVNHFNLNVYTILHLCTEQLDNQSNICSNYR